MQSNLPKLFSLLTQREYVIFNLLCEGKSNAEIGVILDRNINTVNFHVSNILKKFNVSNRIEVAVKARKHGLRPSKDKMDTDIKRLFFNEKN